LKLAAVATTGVGLPNGANFSDIGSVIVLANEDDAARTIRPRLDAVGADIEKVHIIQGVARNHDGLDYFRLDQDIQHLNALVAKLADVRLIIIDPPSAYLGAKIDAYKDSDVRRVLAPLGTLAQNTGALVLLVVHLNKRTDGNAQQRITGSTAWLAAPRAAFLAAEDAKTKNRYLLPVKNNLGNDKTGWQYEIREKLLPYTNLSIKAPYIEWLGESLLSASDILDKKATKPVSVVDEAKEFLEIELSAGSLMTNDIKARASQAGHSWASVKRAKSELPVRSIKTGTSWQWELQQ
jgi:putative DNA primase/helicase